MLIESIWDNSISLEQSLNVIDSAMDASEHAATGI